MPQSVKFIFIGAGSVIAVLALLDIMQIPVEFPTSNDYANLAIGAALVAVPFVIVKI